MIIPVELGDRTYDICIDEEVSFPKKLKGIFPDNTFVLITNTTIYRLYKSKIVEWEKELPLLKYIIEDGEQFKTLETWSTILDFLLQERLDRSAVVIAYGGGVIGDIAGFVASSFMRGVAYIQVPTTLLAMVDSSVGGKVGVNHTVGKNLIGAFYQPRLVWITTQVLETLTDREFNAGYSEVFKYAFIGGRGMFDFILANHDDILAHKKQSLEEAIKRSIEIKAHIVSEDERESGKRALLNLGHTFGHALERFYNFKEITHGEGVNWGIPCAVELGKRLGTISPNDYSTYNAILDKQVLPKLPSKPDTEALYKAMFHDKKVRGGKLRFVLPAKPGTSIVKTDIPEKDIKEILEIISTGYPSPP